MRCLPRWLPVPPAMRCLPRRLLAAALATAALLGCWRLLGARTGELAAGAEEAPPLTPDTFLHTQQLRKKRLRTFCSRSAEGAALPESREARRRLLASARVSTKLHVLYCQVPATGMEGWQQLLEKLEEKENVTVTMPLPYPRQHAPETQLSEFNQSMTKAVMGSYTKVLFVRDPFQRLISAYMQSTGGRHRSFSTFVQGVLDRGQHKASLEVKPLVSLCQPCLIQYDYVMMFGFLRQELGHLLHRVGLPKDTHLPEFRDTQVRWTYMWLSEQLFSELSLKQKQQLSHFYRGDLSAFQFSNSLLSDLLGTPETW